MAKLWRVFDSRFPISLFKASLIGNDEFRHIKIFYLRSILFGCYCLVFPKGFRATISERSFKPIAVSLDVLLILQAFAARIDPKSDAFKVNECKSLW